MLLIGVGLTGEICKLKKQNENQQTQIDDLKRELGEMKEKKGE